MKTIEKITKDLQQELKEFKPNKKLIEAYRTALNLRKNATPEFLQQQLQHIEVVISKKENQLDIYGIRDSTSKHKQDINELKHKRSIVNYVLNSKAEL